MILAIDTATRSISIALANADQVIAEETWQSENNHTTELAPAVERLLATTGIAVGELKALAVAIGPGSFTGVRIGLGFAKGFALARNLPLIGVRTLDITIRALPVEEQTAIAVIQAGRSRVIWAQYEVRDAQWVATDDGTVGTWDDVQGLATGLIVVGEVDATGMKVLQGAGVRVASSDQNIRRASNLAAIGWERWPTETIDSAATLMPIYAHQPTSGTT